ncbi:MAG: MarC family protein [Candidatus Latescibacterota bacterium]
MFSSHSFAFMFTIWLRFFFLFTPFFALTMFLSTTKAYAEPQKRKLAVQVTCAVTVLCLSLFFFGKVVFAIFGITLDAFRVGAGALLFLSAVRLVGAKQEPAIHNPHEDIAVVPLAIPVVVGPATVGALLVLGGEIPDAAQRALGCVALVLAAATMGLILFLGSGIERALGRKGINILSKITGLVLAALAAQMMLTGVQHFLGLGS